MPVSNCTRMLPKGIHGGADAIMRGCVFDPYKAGADCFNRASDHVMGAWSILSGIMANLTSRLAKR